MQPQLEVDERLLHSVAKSVDDVADTLRTALSAARSGISPPPGSAAATAARAAQLTWVTHLDQLHADTKAFATDLVAAAKGYQASDQSGAAKIRGAGAPR